MCKDRVCESRACYVQVQYQFTQGVSNRCMDWNMEWNGECTQLQLTSVTGVG